MSDTVSVQQYCPAVSESSTPRGSRNMTCRVPQFARYRYASKYRSTIFRGSPLRSPHWYSLTNLVAVISARLEIDRSSARCFAVSGRSSARNS